MLRKKLMNIAWNSLEQQDNVLKTFGKYFPVTSDIIQKITFNIIKFVLEF